MLFAAPVLQRHPWSASVTEDIEQHMALILDGERVHFAPDATVWAEMPDDLAKSESQHQRWETGRLVLARRYVPQLLRAAVAALKAGRPRQAFVLLDAIMEHLIPPFAILVAASALLFMLNLLLWLALALGLAPAAARPLASLNLGLSVGLLAGQTIYLLAALRLVRAPRSAYLQLVHAPLYVFWKVRQYARALFSQTRQAWVRTTRNDPL
jgi:cellulose synthase/poly-beta-1,6-N-acetylglucosamine synthase-like glycosyltransferase